MVKCFVGTFDVPRRVRSSYGSIDVMPDAETLENKRIGWRADVHMLVLWNATSMSR